MKKYLSALLAVCLMTAALSMPASALEYTFDNPPTGDFGTPTSTEEIIQTGAEPANKDRSKNSALIPPGFGTPTSYLPNSGEYLTPNLAAGGPLNSPSLNGTVTGSVSGGTVLLPGAVDAPTSSYPTTGSTANTQVTGFTDVTSDLYYSNGSLGTLKIPAIGLTVKVVQGTDSKALAKGAGHDGAKLLLRISPVLTYYIFFMHRALFKRFKHGIDKIIHINKCKQLLAEANSEVPMAVYALYHHKIVLLMRTVYARRPEDNPRKS